MVSDELQEEDDHESDVSRTAVFVGDELSVVHQSTDLLHQLEWVWCGCGGGVVWVGVVGVVWVSWVWCGCGGCGGCGCGGCGVGVVGVVWVWCGWSGCGQREAQGECIITNMLYSGTSLIQSL